MAPVRDTLSPIMKTRGLGRHLEMLELRLDDLTRAAAAGGGTVNDAFMAAVTGGLRRYHDRRGAPVDELRVTMPISIRHPDDPIGGNRITLMRFVVPVSDPDPESRMRALGGLCKAAQLERSLPLTNAIAGPLNLMPSGVVGSMLKHVDFLASDVPGLTFLVYLAGAEVERYSAFGPTTGSSVNLTLVSYNGTCCVGSHDRHRRRTRSRRAGRLPPRRFRGGPVPRRAPRSGAGASPRRNGERTWNA